MNTANNQKDVKTGISLNNVQADNSIRVGIGDEAFTKSTLGIAASMEEMNKSSLQAIKEAMKESNKAILMAADFSNKARDAFAKETATAEESSGGEGAAQKIAFGALLFILLLFVLIAYKRKGRRRQ